MVRRRVLVGAGAEGGQASRGTMGREAHALWEWKQPGTLPSPPRLIS